MQISEHNSNANELKPRNRKQSPEFSVNSVGNFNFCEKISFSSLHRK
jgi:hypothetical protein